MLQQMHSTKGVVYNMLCVVMQVFGHHLSCRENSAAALAAELLQNCSAGMDGQGERSSSPLGHLHIQLLSVVSLSWSSLPCWDLLPCGPC